MILLNVRTLRIIDHHKLGDVTSDSPVEVTIKPVGCSNTVIKELHDYYNVEINPSFSWCYVMRYLI